MLKRNIIAITAYTRKEERSQINKLLPRKTWKRKANRWKRVWGGINNDGKNINFNFKKEEQIKPKANKRNKEQTSIKWKAEKSTTKKINEVKFSSLKKNKIDELLARMTTLKREKTNYQYQEWKRRNYYKY